MSTLCLVNRLSHPPAVRYFGAAIHEPLGDGTNLPVDIVVSSAESSLETVLREIVKDSNTSDVIIVAHGTQGQLVMNLWPRAETGWLDRTTVSSLSAFADKKASLAGTASDLGMTKPEELKRLADLGRLCRAVRKHKIRHLVFRACEIAGLFPEHPDAILSDFGRFFGASLVDAPVARHAVNVLTTRPEGSSGGRVTIKGKQRGRKGQGVTISANPKTRERWMDAFKDWHYGPEERGVHFAWMETVDSQNRWSFLLAVLAPSISAYRDWIVHRFPLHAFDTTSIPVEGLIRGSELAFPLEARYRENLARVAT